MIPINQEFDYPQSQQTPLTYEYGKNCFQRRVLFYHLLAHTIRQKNILSERQQEEGKCQLKEEDLFHLKEEDEGVQKSRNLLRRLEELGHEEIINTDVFDAIYQEEKSSIKLFLLLVIIKGLTSILGLFLFQILISAVMDIQKNYTYLYLLALLTGFTWFLVRCLELNLYYFIDVFYQVQKQALTMIIYERISKVSEYTIRAKQIGKIYNLVNSDFNITESYLYNSFFLLGAPLEIIGTLLIISLKVGWPAVFVGIIILIPIPLQICLGKIKASFLKEANECKDSRMNMYSEVVEGIKFIKMYGWQMSFKDLIQKVRQKEISEYFSLYFLSGFSKAISVVSLYVAILGLFFYLQKTSTLTSAIIVSILPTIMSLKKFAQYLTYGCDNYYFLHDIFERYCTILNLKDIRMVNLQENSTILDKKSQLQQGAIQMNNFKGFWKEDQQSVLDEINLSCKKGRLYGIAGKVGSGKSSLLQAILYQMPYFRGQIDRNGSCAYVEQEPIIFSETLKENVLFGAEFQEQFYQDVIQRSCLKNDLALLENGDGTMLGQKGTTLSGGQKARLALARALYANADIYLLDDPISAVDAKVARQIYEKVIKQLVKKGKTVLLVTHQISYLSECDRVQILEKGKIKSEGTPKELKQEFEILIKKDEQIDLQLLQMDEKAEEMVEQKGVQKKKEEESVVITCGTYFKYIFFSKMNYILFPTVIILFLVSELLAAMFFRILAKYDQAQNGTHPYIQNTQMFWMVLSLMLIGYFTLIIINFFTLNVAVLLSNEGIHSSMIESLVRSPVGFFDVTPSGQLTNKFSNDLNVLDTGMGLTLIEMSERYVSMIVLLGNIMQINHYLILPGVLTIIFSVLFFLYVKSLIVASRQLSQRKITPLFNLVSETISGITQINVLNRRQEFFNSFADKLNILTRSNLTRQFHSRIFSVIINYTMVLLLTIGMLLGIYNLTPSNSSLYGVQIIFLTQISDCLQWALQLIVFLQIYMVNAERTFTVTSLPPEAELETKYDEEQGINSSMKIWPEKADIKVDKVNLRYRQQLGFVLKDFSLKIKDREKVGIVGRTGAGKSSIIQMLFRMVEVQEGSYEIGNCDAQKMGLHTLRRHLSVLPQTPFLFKGTVRMNLDPFNVASETELETAISEVGIKQKIQSLPNKLDENINNTSEVFSVGEKQLLCLARAMLRKNRFLILDEATSNVDFKTDSLIQECIQKNFKETTVITIAHRLNTVANYDTVLVMDKGRIAEVGNPLELIKQKGLFYEMAKHTGHNYSVIEGLAKKAYQQKKEKDCSFVV